MKPSDCVITCICSACKQTFCMFYNGEQLSFVSLEDATLFATEEEAKAVKVHGLVITLHAAKLGKNRIRNETI